MGRKWLPKKVPKASDTLEFWRGSTLYAPRLPADPFARSAVSPQRNLLAAQSPRSAVSFIPSKPGRAPGVGQGPQKKGPGAEGARGRRALRARTGGRALRARGPFGPLGPFGAQGGRLYATKAMPNGIDNTRRKHFRMESIQAEENVRKIKQQQIRVRSMYARDTYTNSQRRAPIHFWSTI